MSTGNLLFCNFFKRSNSMTYETFQKLCNSRGITQADASREIGISQSTLANWKRRGGELSAKNTRKISQFFNVSVDDLLEGSTTRKTSHDGQVYYINDETVDIAKTIYQSHDLSELFNTCRNLSAESLAELIHEAEKMARYESTIKRLSAYQKAFAEIEQS